MEKSAYVLLGIVAVCWIIAVIFGMIAAYPFGLVGLIVIFAIGLLFSKILSERLDNKEDDYYDKNINQ